MLLQSGIERATLLAVSRGACAAVAGTTNGPKEGVCHIRWGEGLELLLLLSLLLRGYIQRRTCPKAS